MPLGAHKAALFGVAGVSTGDVVLLHDTDYSNAASAEITSGIDSTYGEYIFKFYAMNPATHDTHFVFNMSTDGGSNYNATKTTTSFHSYNGESASPHFGYDGSYDLAQSTSDQILSPGQGNAADDCCVGELHLFNPSSTTYVKHFYTTTNGVYSSNYSHNAFVAGYVNSTSAVDAIQFKFVSGNFDGTIKMWGIS